MKSVWVEIQKAAGQFDDYSDADIAGYFEKTFLFSYKDKSLLVFCPYCVILKEEGRRAQTKSYFWVVRTGEDGLDPIMLFNYTPTGAGENAKQFLEGIERTFTLWRTAIRATTK